jgi:hypothetical protein
LESGIHRRTRIRISRFAYYPGVIRGTRIQDEDGGLDQGQRDVAPELGPGWKSHDPGVKGHAVQQLGLLAVRVEYAPQRIVEIRVEVCPGTVFGLRVHRGIEGIGVDLDDR